MKKIITALALISLISSPAQARHRDYERYDRHHHHKKNGCGWACGAIIGGLVVGVIASERDRRDRRYDDRYVYREYDNRYIPPDHRYDRKYCTREQVVEWYHGERYIYWETRCN